jgi:membrane-associated HD superfamily phosphohydrolase
MSFFPRPSGPRAALRDLAAFMRQRSREQVIAAALAILITAIIVIEFVVDSKSISQPQPQVVEVDLYAPNRTDAQIAADQKKDQAEREAQKKSDQAQYNQLAKQLGID